MAGKSRMKSYRPKVMLVVKDASEEALTKLAFQVEAQAKVNIQGNDQIDTGFMLNSVYTVGKNGESSYNSTRPSGKYRSRATQGEAQRTRQAQLNVPEKASAIVAVGAEYAIYQEERKSFLYAAAEKVAAGTPGAEVRTNIRKRVRSAK